MVQHIDARCLIVQKHKVLNVKPPFSFILISIPIAYVILVTKNKMEWLKLLLQLKNFEQYIVTYHIKHDHDLLWQA